MVLLCRIVRYWPEAKAAGFSSVEDTIHDHAIACDLEKRPPFTCPHPMLPLVAYRHRLRPPITQAMLVPQKLCCLRMALPNCHPALNGEAGRWFARPILL